VIGLGSALTPSHILRETTLRLIIAEFSGLQIPQPPNPPKPPKPTAVSPPADSGVDSDHTHSIERTATLVTHTMQSRPAGVKGRRPPSRPGAAAVAASPANITTNRSSSQFADHGGWEYPPAYAPLSISSPPFASELRDLPSVAPGAEFHLSTHIGRLRMGCEVQVFVCVRTCVHVCVCAF
jgi:hypothetical protein